MRLLLSAFSFCPNHGSEPGVGWNTVAQAAADSGNEVHVLVAKGWRERVERNLDAAAFPNIHLHYVGVPGLDHLMTEGRGTALVALVYYHLWQITSYLAAARLHTARPFDLAHHVTFVKYNTPSLLPLLGIPFVWGPLGGAEHAPAVFYREFGWKTRLVEAVRRGLQKLAPWSPLLRWTASRATVAVGVTRETVDALKELGAVDVRLLPAVALNEAELDQIKVAQPDGALTLLYAGRLIAWKGVHLALRALAGQPAVLLRIIGDGPLRGWLETEAARLGVTDRVTFEGELPRRDLLAAYASAHGFLYPSLHDSGGNALIEAMAAGLPVIHLAYGGPSGLVPESAGYKVAAATPEAAVNGLSNALRQFVNDPDDRQARARAALDYARNEHTWASRGQAVRRLYQELIEGA